MPLIAAGLLAAIGLRRHPGPRRGQLRLRDRGAAVRPVPGPAAAGAARAAARGDRATGLRTPGATAASGRCCCSSRWSTSSWRPRCCWSRRWCCRSARLTEVGPGRLGRGARARWPAAGDGGVGRPAAAPDARRAAAATLGTGRLLRWSIGLRPSTLLIAVGVFGMMAGLTAGQRHLRDDRRRSRCRSATTAGCSP